MADRSKGWWRLGVVLWLAWAAASTFWAGLSWVQVAQLERWSAQPFAVWIEPGGLNKPFPARLILEWECAFDGRSVTDGYARGYEPHFCWSVFLTFLFGPPIVALVCDVAVRWVRAGFPAKEPLPAVGDVLPFVPPVNEPPRGAAQQDAIAKGFRGLAR